MTANTNARLKGKEHIPNYPSGFVILRILQLVFSVVILAMLCYTVYWAAFVGNCLMLFTTIATFIASLWMVVAHTCAPQAYNYWAVLSLDIFLVVFWLISFAILAADTAIYWAAGNSYCDWYSCYDDTLYGAALVYGSIMAAASGLGALEFLFFFISLVIHSIMICRHRRAGLHNTPIRNGTGPQPVPLQHQQPQGFNQQPVYNQAPPAQNFAPQPFSPEKQHVHTPPPQAQFYPAQGQQQPQFTQPVPYNAPPNQGPPNIVAGAPRYQ